jgi:hypothetical protein
MVKCKNKWCKNHVPIYNVCNLNSISISGIGSCLDYVPEMPPKEQCDAADGRGLVEDEWYEIFHGICGDRDFIKLSRR